MGITTQTKLVKSKQHIVLIVLGFILSASLLYGYRHPDSNDNRTFVTHIIKSVCACNGDEACINDALPFGGSDAALLRVLTAEEVRQFQTEKEKIIECSTVKDTDLYSKTVIATMIEQVPISTTHQSEYDRKLEELLKLDSVPVMTPKVTPRDTERVIDIKIEEATSPLSSIDPQNVTETLLGNTVTLKNSNGKELVGEIIAIHADRIQIKINLYGGYVERIIPKHAIKSITLSNNQLIQVTEKSGITF